MSLLIFLGGTLDPKNPLSLFRGQRDVLRIIWTYVCEEWWNLHVERSLEEEIPDLSESWEFSYPVERQRYGGCPVATVARNVIFPPLTSLPPSSLPHQQEDFLYLNMMPFDILDQETLPPFCRQYWSLIQSCVRLVDPRSVRADQQGFLSIDERPAPSGRAQRREGLHVESPGILPLIGEMESHSQRFVPGVEHHWGNGIMMRSEYVEGGIFLGSSRANTTAVWNCRIRDDHGDIIAPHGSIERCRPLLGPPTRTLEAGEIVWLTDKTPHESLPGLHSSTTPRRQFFRLVIGEVTAWFADHSTPNPTGYRPSAEVRVVVGNKYELYASLRRILWVPGTAQEIALVTKENALREIVSRIGLGHIVDRFLSCGIRTIDDLILRVRESRNDSPGMSFLSSFAGEYRHGNHLSSVPLTHYEVSRLRDLIKLTKSADASMISETISLSAGQRCDDFERVRVRLLEMIEERVQNYEL
jgi:hypothetical protein